MSLTLTGRCWLIPPVFDAFNLVRVSLYIEGPQVSQSLKCVRGRESKLTIGSYEVLQMSTVQLHSGALSSRLQVRMQSAGGSWHVHTCMSFTWGILGMTH